MAMQISPSLHCIDIAKQPADTVFYSPEVPWAQVPTPDGSSSEHKETGSRLGWIKVNDPE